MPKAGLGVILGVVLVAVACSNQDSAPVAPSPPPPTVSAAPTQTYTPPTPEPPPPATVETPEPTEPPVERNYVPLPNGGDDDHHKSHFCRRHWYC